MTAALAVAAPPLRPFCVVAWIDCAWWGHLPYDAVIFATSKTEAMQQMEEDLHASGARIRAITCHEELAG